MSANEDGRRGGEPPAADRAQLVLAAAVVVAVALIPMALAYHQLGYRADVAADGAAEPSPSADAERLLQRAVANASGTIDGDYAWPQRADAVARLNATLRPDVGRVESSRVDAGVLYDIERNASAASAWAGDNCPDGSGRRFGACDADDGVVVQERAGEVTLVAVAYDVGVRSERRSANLTFVVEPIER